MKKILFVTILLITNITIAQQNLVYDWAKPIGRSLSDKGQSIAVDQNLNVITGGTFRDTVDFDPSVGVSTLISQGADDVFIQKLDANGDFVWVKALGGVLNQNVGGIVSAPNGDLYIAGWFQSTVDFDPGIGVESYTAQGHDPFLLKLNANGDFIWVKIISGIQQDYAFSIALDGNGNIYTAGQFSASIDFDPNAGVTTLTSAGSVDGFVQKLDENGNFMWAKTIGGSSGDLVKSLATDANNNVYVTGTFVGTVDFDPGMGVDNQTAVGVEDIFIEKLDENGNYVWAKTFGGDNYDNGIAITVDSNGDVYSTGSYQSVTDFDPGVGVFNLTPAGAVGYKDVFVLKLDANGDFIWAKSFGGSVDDIGYSIKTDSDNNVYTLGDFKNVTGDFDPNTGVFNLTADGNDFFIQKLNSNGDFILAKSIGGSGYDHGQALSVDFENNIYVTGSFNDTVDFDPNIGVNNLVVNKDIIYPAPQTDGFVLKLNSCVNNTGIDVLVECDTLVWIDGVTYTSSNNMATYTLTNIGGCDSVVTLDLTIINSNTGTDVQEACVSYDWIDGNTYTSSNNSATHTLTNLLGCDSVVTLNLTINLPDATTDVQQTCDSLIWIDGITYYDSNNLAEYTLTNVNGCDSVVSLDLTVISIDVSVVNSSPTIIANTFGATYQWLDCNNNYAPISGATNQSFTAVSNGSYAVEVTQNNCSDTSACELVENVGLKNSELVSNIDIYPNPTNGVVTVNMGQNHSFVKVMVYDITGKEINSVSYQSTHQFDFSLIGERGVYFVKFITVSSESAVFKIIKE